VRELGELSVLVNAAGTDVPGSAEDLSLEEWERVLAVNLTAPFMLTRAAMPHMRERGGGLVVNISSVAGRRGWANASAYCATKFALTGLTQALAAEGRDDGIRVCVLYPGAMSTSWGTFEPTQRDSGRAQPADARVSLDPAVVADLIAWMATAPGQPVLNEVTMTPLREALTVVVSPSLSTVFRHDQHDNGDGLCHRRCGYRWVVRTDPFFQFFAPPLGRIGLSCMRALTR
jgi:NAD(P)-dependent dehydrogenase (short-subunit alcohol dehydrogenase family)